MTESRGELPLLRLHRTVGGQVLDLIKTDAASHAKGAQVLILLEAHGYRKSINPESRTGIIELS